MTPPRGQTPAYQPAVLAVDDDPLVLGFMQAALQRSGFNVIVAKSGHEALEEFERIGGAVDVLVSDVVMPVMDGPALAKEISKTKPELPVLFVSGYIKGPDELKGTANLLRLEVLHKPFSSDLLVRSVKRLLPQ